MKPVRLCVGAGILALSLVASSEVFAQSASSCQTDFAKIAGRRQTYIDQVNKMTKTHGGKLDPVGACPLFRNLAAVQGQLVKYVNTNKNWCNIPDDVVKNSVAEQAKFSSIAGQACKVAAQAVSMRKQQLQQGQQGAAGPKNGNAFNAPETLHLPSGPL